MRTERLVYYMATGALLVLSLTGLATHVRLFTISEAPEPTAVDTTRLSLDGDRVGLPVDGTVMLYHPMADITTAELAQVADLMFRVVGIGGSMMPSTEAHEEVQKAWDSAPASVRRHFVERG